uniref:USP domain-containing protein n=1 Tax=Spongospora subterranea TaxID=70186 RepID=A0A0H5RCB7_9EUKA|eukprot:CRZ11391.1 hypothetical protein [Spongospora subterranea]
MQAVLILEIICKGKAVSGAYNTSDVGSVRIYRVSNESYNDLVLRVYPASMARDFAFERTLNPEVGIWRITQNPIDKAYASKMSFTYKTSNKMLEINFNHGYDVQRLFALIKEITSDFNPDKERAPCKRRPVPIPHAATPSPMSYPRSILPKRHRQFGIVMPNTLTPAKTQSFVPAVYSAPASFGYIAPSPSTPSRNCTVNNTRKCLTAKRSSPVRTPTRLKVKKALDFDDFDEENVPPSTNRPFSPSRDIIVSNYSRGGLRNIGNSCYMNSCLSALHKSSALVSELVKFIESRSTVIVPIDLDEELDDQESEQQSVLDTFLKVGRLLQSGDSGDGAASETRQLRRSLGQHQPVFAGRAQQDAHEFLSQLIEQLCVDIVALPPNDSKFNLKTRLNIPGIRQFISITANTLQCSKCQYIRANTEECWNYSLDLPNSSSSNPLSTPTCQLHGHQIVKTSKKAETFGRAFWACAGTNSCTAAPFQWVLNPPDGQQIAVQRLLSEYFGEHSVEYRCERCENNEVIIKPVINRISEVLILHLKRFQSDHKTNSCKKRNDAIAIDVSLDMTKYCSDPPNTGVEYTLCSIVSHLGHHSSNGHYVHDYRDPKSAQWTRYDDSTVRSIKADRVLDEARTQAYILFYTLKTT